MNHLAGGRLFPGEHHRARFTAREAADSIDLAMRSDDRKVSVRVRGRLGGSLQVEEVHSSYFFDEAKFPRGSVDLGHEWRSAEDLYV